MLTIILLFAALVYGQEPETLFKQGVEQYRQGNWEGAAKSWETVRGQGEVSGALYYNLGNAYHRMGQIGRSILFFERAKRLTPRDRDVQSNLDLAKMATVDRIEPPVRLVIWDWVDDVRDFFSLNELARNVLAVGMMLIVLYVVWRFGPLRFRPTAQKVFTACAVLYILGVSWYFWRSHLDSRPEAVVIETKVDVYSAPDSAATQVFTLHEGTKVSMLDHLTGWTRVRLPDGRQGWMPTETMEQI